MKGIRITANGMQAFTTKVEYDGQILPATRVELEIEADVLKAKVWLLVDSIDLENIEAEIIADALDLGPKRMVR